MLSKIVYFDRETIRNILQEANKGELSKSRSTDVNTAINADIQAEASVGLSVPFFTRLKFLFSGKAAASFIYDKKTATTISSTDISEFENVKDKFAIKESVRLSDIENSSSFFRVATGYIKIAQSGIEGVDVNKFQEVLDSFEGYDTYSISPKEYVRFNNTAYISNYKRNEILLSKLDIYCILVGDFDPGEFDFMEQMKRMQTLITDADTPQTITQWKKDITTVIANDSQAHNSSGISDEKNRIKLYDVVMAKIIGDDPQNKTENRKAAKSEMNK